jgi:hypothetical protein
MTAWTEKKGADIAAGGRHCITVHGRHGGGAVRRASRLQSEPAQQFILTPGEGGGFLGGFGGAIMKTLSPDVDEILFVGRALRRTGVSVRAFWADIRAFSFVPQHYLRRETALAELVVPGFREFNIGFFKCVLGRLNFCFDLIAALSRQQRVERLQKYESFGSCFDILGHMSRCIVDHV